MKGFIILVPVRASTTIYKIKQKDITQSSTAVVLYYWWAAGCVLYASSVNHPTILFLLPLLFNEEPSDIDKYIASV